eukprot:m.67819 g.67819  ORF g.67819 m.67819 type:complete len:559 (+) comp11915_c0_seq2:83-1759(+)
MNIQVRQAFHLFLSYGLLAFTAATDCDSGYAIRGECVPTGVSPLDYYVNKVTDNKFGWTGPTQTYMLDDVTVYVLNLTSQSWLSAMDFKPTSRAGTVWYHQLAVTIPAKINDKNNQTGWLWITGGDNNPSNPIPQNDKEVIMAANLSHSTGTIGAVLKQVPNQPVEFAVDIPHPSFMYPNESREEDGIIAYTWNHAVLKNTSDIEWALRLPMTKSVSSAMTAITEFVTSKNIGISGNMNFVVGGESKRGWTTWTTGLVEPRCKAIVPVVMDFMDVVKNVEHHYQSLGGYTFEFADYIAADMIGNVINTPAYTKLMNVVDPYSYFKPQPAWDTPRYSNFYTMPKYVVSAGNDEFMLPGDDHAWWNNLPGDKHVLHIANADHPLRFWPPGSGNGSKVFSGGLLAFYSSIVYGTSRPSFEWSYLGDNTSPSSITVGNLTEQPLSVTLWQAQTTDGFRDWRLFNCRSAIPGNNCTHYEGNVMPNGPAGYPRPHPVQYMSSLITKNSKGEYVGTCKLPPNGQFNACFMDVIFSNGFRSTTQIFVNPDTRPFYPCNGANCSRMV